MWGSSALKTPLQIQALWKFICIVLLILVEISRWPYFCQDEFKGPQIPSKSYQNASEDLPNPPEIAPNRLQMAPEALLGTMWNLSLNKNWIFNVKEVAQRRPGAIG